MLQFGRLRPDVERLWRAITDRLRTLEAQGIVSRTIYAEVPLHVEYRLTEREKRLAPIFQAIKGWVNSEDANPSVQAVD